MNTLTNNQKVLIAALVGFIIGAGAIWVWTISNSATTGGKAVTEDVESVSSEKQSTTEKAADVTKVTKDPAAPAETSVSTTLDNSELVKVTSQKAGATVMVTATLDAPGWVAIHEDRSGNLGNVLGAGWAPAGKHDLTVTLLRNTEAGKTYHAVLYSDDGDRQFEYGIDARLLDSAKQPMQAQFIAQ